MEDDEVSPYMRFVGIALVVTTRGREYVSVKEHTGWYLPAGRVDYGEAFTVGAIRETLEEAGIPVRLTGIYRIEQCAMRMRVIFGAETIDNTPLKTIPDEETLTAEWVTVESLSKLRLRSNEVMSIFKWVDNGAPLYPIDLYEGENGKEIDNKNVVTKVLHTSKIVVKQDNLFLAVVKESSIELPSRIMMNPPIRQHKENAKKLLEENKLPIEISGLYKIQHTPPQTRDNPEGTLTFIFSTTSLPSHTELPKNLQWKEAHHFTQPQEKTLLVNITEGKASHAPISILTLEGAPYS